MTDLPAVKENLTLVDIEVRYTFQKRCFSTRTVNYTPVNP